MFLDNWIPKKYLVKSEVCVVEASFGADGVNYFYTILKNRGGKLDLLETNSTGPVLHLPRSVEKNKIPVIVVYSGTGIILKKVELSQHTSNNVDQILQENLPALNIKDFYAQLYKQGNSTGYVGLCRKSLVDKVVENLKSEKYEVISFFIGPAVILGAKPLLNSIQSLNINQYLIQFSDGWIQSIVASGQHLDEVINIESIKIRSFYILGLAAGVSYFLRTSIAETADPVWTEMLVRHSENNKLRFAAVLVVAIAFVAAITNVIFYTTFFDRNNKLEAELSVYQGKYEKINELLGNYQKNIGLIENVGMLTKNQLSEFADRIAQTIPEEVVLAEFILNPRKNSDETEDSLAVFQNKYLILKGKCNKSLIINEWVNVLKTQEFVRDVRLEKFNYAREGQLPNFEIRLTTE